MCVGRWGEGRRGRREEKAKPTLGLPSDCFTPVHAETSDGRLSECGFRQSLELDTVSGSRSMKVVLTAYRHVMLLATVRRHLIVTSGLRVC